MAALRELADTIPQSRLMAASEALSRRYRAAKEGGSLRIAGDDEAAAYAIARMPATAAALTVAVDEALSRVTARPSTVLDLGSGPGTTAFVLAEHMPETSLTLVEEHAAMQRLGTRLMGHLPGSAIAWHKADLLRADLPADWIIASYALGEIAEDRRRALMLRLYRQAQQLIILVEPGTPRGFEAIRSARETLLACGGEIVAPCPHGGDCPMTDENWCHFSIRLNRLKAHRIAKSGDRSFEDEPFSYCIIAKPGLAPRPAQNRVLRVPYSAKSGIKLTLCTADGSKEQFIPARDKAMVRANRHIAWGDAFPLEDNEG